MIHDMGCQAVDTKTTKLGRELRVTKTVQNPE